MPTRLPLPASPPSPPAVNTGQFVMLPTPASLAFAERWNSLAASMIPQGPATQPALRQMHHHHFEACTSLCQCFWAHRNVGRQPACLSVRLPASSPVPACLHGCTPACHAVLKAQLTHGPLCLRPTQLTSLGLRNDTPIFRTYYPGYFAYTQVGARAAAQQPAAWLLAVPPAARLPAFFLQFHALYSTANTIYICSGIYARATP